MSIQLPNDLLDKTRYVIDRYSLIDPGDSVIVALSGGKDSLLLTLILRALGINHVPVVVDMGYEPGWGQRVRQITDAVGVTARFIDARRPHPKMGAAHPTAAAIRSNAALLDTLPRQALTNFTPCTQCYNLKVLALSTVASTYSASKVAYGHHLTDAAASLLKEAIMHIDRWDRLHAKFERTNYERLLNALIREGVRYKSDVPSTLLDRISELVQYGAVDTDEPPRQQLLPGHSELEIIRPLFLLDEHALQDARDRMNLRTEGSGCGHGGTAMTQTPREMVQFRLLHAVPNSGFRRHVKRLVVSSIDDKGRARVGSRRRRQELLGPHYKPAMGNSDKL
jgi:hypothetical protein